MKKGENGHELSFPNDETEVRAEKKEKSSKYLGVSWSTSNSRWLVSRRSKIQRKTIYNGTFNSDLETKAAHASDTLAKKLKKNGENGHELNFPNDEREVRTEKK